MLKVSPLQLRPRPRRRRRRSRSRSPAAAGLRGDQHARFRALGDRETAAVPPPPSTTSILLREKRAGGCGRAPPWKSKLPKPLKGPRARPGFSSPPPPSSPAGTRLPRLSVARPGHTGAALASALLTVSKSERPRHGRPRAPNQRKTSDSAGRNKKWGCFPNPHPTKPEFASRCRGRR